MRKRIQYILGILICGSCIYFSNCSSHLEAPVNEEFSPPAYVVAYKEKGFSGKSERFSVGDYSKLDDDWSEEIKSVELIGGVRVTLFDEDRFEGEKIVLEHSAHDLGDLEGDAESMIVERFHCASAVAYKETIFRGKSRTFPEGEYPELGDGWDEAIESIDLCGDVVVTLFEDENFQGDSIQLDRDHIDLGKFKDDAESMIVEVIPR